MRSVDGPGAFTVPAAVCAPTYAVNLLSYGVMRRMGARFDLDATPPTMAIGGATFPLREHEALYYIDVVDAGGADAMAADIFFCWCAKNWVSLGFDQGQARERGQVAGFHKTNQ